MQELDILILGAGWTAATFLIPLLRQRNLRFAATTTTGRRVGPDNNTPTIPWRFDPAAPPRDTEAALAALPRARHVLVTFPLRGAGPSALLVRAYNNNHPGGGARFIQLGSTGIWSKDDNDAAGPSCWLDRASPYDRADARAVAEDELLRLGGCVLELAGLWGGGDRSLRRWVDRVAGSRAAVAGKTSVHMVHGADVARVVVALLLPPPAGGAEQEAGGAERWWDAVGKGQRWMVTDGFVYDWWCLFASWAEGADEGGGGGGVDAEPSKQAKWVYELMDERGVRALPRSMEALGRCYDSRELWKTLRITPLKAGLGL